MCVCAHTRFGLFPPRSPANSGPQLQARAWKDRGPAASQRHDLDSVRAHIARSPVVQAAECASAAAQRLRMQAGLDC